MMNRFVLAAVTAGLGNAAAAEGKPNLIPREVLFGNPDKASPEVSPDGRQLAYLAPVDGVLNVWVGPANAPDQAKAVTADKKRGIRQYFWAYTNEHILYLQDKGGDEDFHLYLVNLKTGETKDLTPFEKIRAIVQQVSHKTPETILVGVNDRDARFHDVYKIDLKTGQRTLVQKNDGYSGFVTDDDNKVRFANKFDVDGSTVYYEPASDGWKEFLRIPSGDTLTTGLNGFDRNGGAAYIIDSRGRDTGAVFKLDLKTGKKELLAESDKADAGGLLVHPTEKNVQAVSFTYARREWKILDPKVAADFAVLKKVRDGDPSVVSRTLADDKWVVAYTEDDGPVVYYMYDRAAKKATKLFTNNKDLEGQPLVPMRPVVIESRDGLKLVCYLSLPKGSAGDDHKPMKPLPTVMFIHGGPWARDNWGYNPVHQMLADRGYAVMSVNYRGSTGFGKNFINAGNKEWAGKMHDDLIDAKKWLIEKKIADPENVAIMGGSYGGYATLVGVTFTPKEFACGVDIVGPSSLVTLLKTIPPYWAPAMQLFKDRVGDVTSEAGRNFLMERSPLSRVEKIEKPLLIGQGANDPRVKQSESDQIVKAMKEKKIPVTYVLFPDEGHGFARPENRIAFFAVAEAFLAEHLGGQYEPIGDAFGGSSVTVPAGADGVPGLAAALPKKE